MELRPALDGFFGIPQETRLLFSALAGLSKLELSGLLQMSTRRVKGGVAASKQLSEAERVHRYARAVVSLLGESTIDWKQSLSDTVLGIFHRIALFFRAWGIGRLQLNTFETHYFRDFIWRHLFARSVPPPLREEVLRHDHLICSTPWRWMHLAGIERAWLAGRAAYPRLDTAGIDVLIAQTPYPSRVAKGTKLVVHYHDAIPVLMPHTISDRAFHEASHYHALAANVKEGAWFVCVSEATRQDLIMLFPEAEPRAVTIHNMIPMHYFTDQPQPERLPGIVRRHQHVEYRGKAGMRRGPTELASTPIKLSKQFGNDEEKTDFYNKTFAPGTRYLLMVSTVEPRKNHIRLIEAWLALRDQVDPDLKLVLVGHLGWEVEPVINACLPGIEQGMLFMLHSVPPESLRLLYQHALVCICPSVGEGFDFSGVEAMRCGGVVAASDIAVHREIYGDAAEYFNPYDTSSLVQALRRLIVEQDAASRREDLRRKGQEQSARYLPERIVPQWEAFLRRITQSAAH
jgi:glycosyltransferase involved in cell wall biosynthesis